MADVLSILADFRQKACQKWQNSCPESGAYLPPLQKNKGGVMVAWIQAP